MNKKTKKATIYFLVFWIICNLLFGALPQLTESESLLYSQLTNEDYSYLECIRDIQNRYEYYTPFGALLVYPGFCLGKYINNLIQSEKTRIPRGKPQERKMMVLIYSTVLTVEFFYITKHLIFSIK